MGCQPTRGCRDCQKEDFPAHIKTRELGRKIILGGDAVIGNDMTGKENLVKKFFPSGFNSWEE